MGVDVQRVHVLDDHLLGVQAVPSGARRVRRRRQGQLGLRDPGAQQGGLALYVQGAGREPDVSRQPGQPSRHVARAPQDLNATAGYRRLDAGVRLHTGKQQRRDQEGLSAAESLPK